MKWFTINGIEYNVRILEAKESFTILYSENTYRVSSEGAPMVFDPLGTFFNYSITIGAKRGSEKDFEDLWNALSRPRYDPMLVTFPKSRTEIWTTTDNDGSFMEGFWAYVSASDRGIKKIVENPNGELKDVIYDAFTVNFIASKAQVLPE